MTKTYSNIKCTWKYRDDSPLKEEVYSIRILLNALNQIDNAYPYVRIIKIVCNDEVIYQED